MDHEMILWHSSSPTHLWSGSPWRQPRQTQSYWVGSELVLKLDSSTSSHRSWTVLPANFGLTADLEMAVTQLQPLSNMSMSSPAYLGIFWETCMPLFIWSIPGACLSLFQPLSRASFFLPKDPSSDLARDILSTQLIRDTLCTQLQALSQTLVPKPVLLSKVPDKLSDRIHVCLRPWLQAHQ